jgi:DNA-binding transcriptional ArsR family regulator
LRANASELYPTIPSSFDFAVNSGTRGLSLTGDQIVTYSRRMDLVFKALADPTRRGLLDELYQEDGQTLSALERRLAMTRFRVMKHLKVLEQAGLVVTRRRERKKLHFLNPVPIRLVHDRWVSKYAEPSVTALSELKSEIEENGLGPAGAIQRPPHRRLAQES